MKLRIVKYYTIGEGAIQVKNFPKNFYLEMTPLGIKTCGESEFDIFEAKKHLPDSEKACILKRKIAFLRLFASIYRP
jgi:hypothetical protein